MPNRKAPSIAQATVVNRINHRVAPANTTVNTKPKARSELAGIWSENSNRSCKLVFSTKPTLLVVLLGA